MPVRSLTVLPAPKSKSTVQASRVVIYERVSSKEQREEGYSIEAQLRLLRNYAVNRGFVIAEEFTDVESASKSGRTRFNEMLAYLRKHPACRVILVEKTDRLYRNLAKDI
jgi:site-specific DNA recombinase